MVLRAQRRHEMPADEAGAAGHENWAFHSLPVDAEYQLETVRRTSEAGMTPGVTGDPLVRWL